MPGEGEDESKQGVRKKSDTQEKPTSLCQSLFVIAGTAFLASLYSFSFRPGRFKEKEKLEISSMMGVKELSKKVLSSQIQVLKCCSWLWFWTSASQKDFLSMLFYGRLV